MNSRVLMCGLLLMLVSLGTHAAHSSLQREITSLLNSYAQAIERLDTERMVQFYRKSADFFVFSDGKTYSYEELSNSARSLPATVRRVDTVWDDIQVKSLNPTAAVAFATFHQTVVAADGAERKLVGEVSWVVVRERGAWKFAYGHANHRPAP